MKDPYVYKDSDVLINKANLKEKDKLDEFENRMTNLALVMLFRSDFGINDASDIFKIHKMLFENVYEWAGKPRTINIYKSEPILQGLSVEYSSYQTIEKELDEINNKYLKNNINNLNKEDFIYLFVRLISDVWRVHPFREGNTRTISAFAFLFLRQYNYEFNAKLIKDNAKYFRNALVMASLKEYSEYKYLEKIITDAVGIKDFSKITSKYKKIKDYNVEDYEYVYHKIKKGLIKPKSRGA